MWIAAGFATALLALATAAWLVRPERRPVLRGSWPEFRDHVAMLCERRRDLRGLRMALPGIGPGHLRILRDGSGLRLEVPADTEAERAFEPAFREACKQRGIVPTAITRATDRRRVMTALLPGHPASVIETAAAIVDATYEVGPTPEIHITLLY